MDSRYKEALEALELLESSGFPSMLAGGCVRDRALGIQPKDFDIATSGEPLAVQKIFSARGFKIIPTGLDHGTQTLVGECGQYEITTLRRDVSTDGRRAVVAFTRSFEEDAARRDFTINAMFEDRNGKIYDFCGGLNHIKERRLVFVGDPRQRIQEDYLRILRFFRFWARLGFNVTGDSTDEAHTLAAIAEFSAGLKRISQERVTSELLQILATVSPGKALASMNATGVWAVICPEIAWHPKFPNIVEAIGGGTGSSTEEVAIVRLAALVASAAKSEDTARGFGKRLRLSTSDIYKLTCFTHSLRLLQDPRLLDDDALCLRLVDSIDSVAGQGAFQRIFLTALKVYLSHQVGLESSALHLSRVVKVESEFGEVRRATMPIDGKVLIGKLKLKPGPLIKDLLEYLKDRYRARDWSTSDQGIQLAQQYLHQKRESAK